MSMAGKIVFIALAGACGTLCRYGLSVLSIRMLGEAFPYGTMLANMLGCFLFGAVAGLADLKGILSPELRLILLTGFMGAFTTFSSLIFDSYKLHEFQGLFWGIFNISIQVALGFILFWLGLRATGA